MSQTATLKTSLNCAILTISSSRASVSDTSGDYLNDSVLAAGHHCVKRAIIDGGLYQIRRTVSEWIADDNIDVILTNGGTGFTHQKSTVAAITPLLDTAITGFGELFRHLSFLEIGSSSLQSDAFAGSANNTLIFCMPGSTNACKTAWQKIIAEQLDSTHKPCNFAGRHAAPE